MLPLRFSLDSKALKMSTQNCEKLGGKGKNCSASATSYRCFSEMLNRGMLGLELKKLFSLMKILE